MTQGITGKEPDPREVYADIIELPRHVSDHHPPMSLYDRAAQFAPFAALAGYDEMVAEEARLEDRRIELSEEETAELNRALRRIGRALDRGEKPLITMTRFFPDPLKPGGRYETVTERIRRIDIPRQELILDRTGGFSGAFLTVPIGNILEIQEPEGIGEEEGGRSVQDTETLYSGHAL